MAPLPTPISSPFSDIFVSSFQLERRDFSLPSSLSRKRTENVSPLKAGSYLFTRDPPPQLSQNVPGAGTWDPHNINNRGIFALFALLGAALVFASIWFFFWAKNGGFEFRKGDWEEYKSTVLRRKGPDGKTLSNATKTTKLGGGSVVAEIDQENEHSFIKKGAQKPKSRKPRGNKNNADEDVRAYRNEKPAKVGGLNREADGSYNTEVSDFGYSNDPSEYSSQATPIPMPSSSKPKAEPEPKTPLKKFNLSKLTPSSNSSQRPLRPSSGPSTDSTPTRSRQPSPRKSRAPSSSVPGSYTEPLDFESRYTAGSEAETDQGTKAYFHPIPGLGRNGDGGGAGQGGGFRRGGGRGRRDSLSDSEGEGTMLS